MSRINVYAEYTDGDDGEGQGELLEGWFNPAKAERFDEGRDFDGSNMISVITRSQWEHEALYRTAGGRWVRYHWSQWQGSRETDVFETDDAAKEWLIRSEVNDDALEKHFGGLPEESAPVGRPREGR